MRFILCILCCIAVSSILASDLSLDLSEHPHIKLKVAAPLEIESSYTDVVSDVSCEKYHQPEGQYLPRGTIELIILCRALSESGLIPTFEFVPSPNYSRSVLMVESGDVHFSSETVWYSDIDHSKVWSSHPIIRDYELEKGLYALKDSPAFNSTKPKPDVWRFNGVTIKNWHADWDVIKRITPTARSVFHFSSIYETLRLGRADFTLLEFPNSKDLGLQRGDLQLFPIPGVKVRLPGSRHFIVSRRFRNSHEIHALLNSGLSSLRDSGVIEQIYRESGLPNPITKDWEVINLERHIPFENFINE